jgi:hypothetical protein
MRTETEISRYQKTLAQVRDNAKATIASMQPNSEAYTEAIKVFLRCDGAIEIMNWVMGLGSGDFSVSPAMAQRERERAGGHRTKRDKDSGLGFVE